MPFSSFAARVDQAREAGRARFVVPVARRLSADLLTPVAAFLALRATGPLPFLFESVEGGEKLARYSFLGAGPYAVVQADRAAVATVRRLRPSPLLPAGAPLPEGSLLDVLGDLLGRFDEVRVPGLPRLTGGAVGYAGYDTVRVIERLPDAPADDLGLPDAVWAFYDTLAAFDHVRHQLVLLAHAFVTPDDDAHALRATYDDAHARLDRLAADLTRTPPHAPAPVVLGEADTDAADGMASTFAQEAFEDAVRTAQEHIVAGDIFQVVLSQRFAMPFAGDRFNLYRALRQVNPSPYLFYLEFAPTEGFDGLAGEASDFALVGSSPEVLVRVEDGRAEVLPIAGTRPRGMDEAEDLALEEDLLADPKERAEHLMLVDLGRNDLGRVSKTGTISVDRYAFVERYSHVMHIVSQVVGEVDAAAHTPVDVLAACFPAGTVSGAPKVRAMEIIDALEPVRRGIYAGAVGHAGFGGTLDTCIAIRTMVATPETIYVQAGAGIVADSHPTAEYEETRNKARALREAMRVAADDLL